MKSLNNCATENCIPSQSSCTDWNGGDIPFLGVCNGESINTVISEIISRLQEIVADDLSSFDIDSLLSICTQKAPLEVNLLSILNVLKNNDICLKDYIDTLSDQITALSTASAVIVNLKCYADFDNLGNALQITREQLDQLVIDQLCNHKSRIETLEGKIITLQAEVDDIDPFATVVEPNITTCVDGTPKATSLQVKSVASELCALETANGNPAKIASALSKTPADWNTKFSTITGWNLTPAQWADAYGNLLLVVNDLEARILSIEQNCCQITCDDVKIGFSVTLNESGDGIILTFTSGAGTQIPNGFTDKGSNGTITDSLGNVIYFNVAIANNATEEISITGLNLSGELVINLTTKIGNGSTLCVGCIEKTITLPSSCCVITNTSTGDVTIFYQTPINPAG